MGRISKAKLDLVRDLIERAPDEAVRSLLLALSADGGHDAGLTHVQMLVQAEAADRHARNLVLASVAALCAPALYPDNPRFPPRTLGLIWKVLKETAPHEMVQASALAASWRGEESCPDILNELCRRVVDGLREDDGPFEAAAASADEGAGRKALISALQIAPVARRAIEQLPEWLGRMTSEKSAKLRLSYRDVVAIADDAGPLFFEILAARLNESWLILRIISGVMDRPNEAYLSGSELAVFGERVFADIDRHLAALGAFKAASGRPAARAAAQATHAATVEITEIEQCVNLSPDGPWGGRLARQKRTLAAAVETLLKAADGAVGQALPLQTMRMGPRAARGIPRLTHDPDPDLVERAATLLVFLADARNSAAAGGFAASRAKALETVEARLDTYVEDLLDEIRSDENEFHDRARAYLEIAADLCSLVRDDKAAQIIRRRAAAA